METLSNISTFFIAIYPILFLILAVVSIANDVLKVRAAQMGKLRFAISFIGWVLAVMFVAYAKWGLVADNLGAVK